MRSFWCIPDSNYVLHIEWIMVVCIFLRNWLISSNLPDLHRVVCSISYFLMLAESIVILRFNLNIGNLCLLSYMTVLLEVCQFCWSFQRARFCSIDVHHCFSAHNFIAFFSLLFPSLRFFWIYFALLFLSSWGEDVDYWSETFLFS